MFLILNLDLYKLLKLWQDFTALFHKHLIDAEELDDFYFELLEEASVMWNKQFRVIQDMIWDILRIQLY